MLPSTGTISLDDVAAELGVESRGINLNDSRVRTLANKSVGAISLDDLHGKSAASPGGSVDMTKFYYAYSIHTYYGYADNRWWCGNQTMRHPWENGNLSYKGGFTSTVNPRNNQTPYGIGIYSQEGVQTVYLWFPSAVTTGQVVINIEGQTLSMSRNSKVSNIAYATISEELLAAIVGIDPMRVYYGQLNGPHKPVTFTWA